MTIKRVPIAEATDEQIRFYATSVLNLEIDGRATPASILSKITSAVPGETHIVYDDGAASPMAYGNQPSEQGTGYNPPPLPAEGVDPRAIFNDDRYDPMATIRINVVESEDGSGNEPVAVGVNGKAWQLARGVDIEVPYRVVEALRNAVTRSVRHENGNITTRDASRFTFQEVKMPSATELAQWRDLMAGASKAAA